MTTNTKKEVITKQEVITYKGTLEGGLNTVALPTFDKHTFLGKTENLVANFPSFTVRPHCTVTFNKLLVPEVNFVNQAVIELNGKKYQYTFLCGYKKGIKHARYGDKEGMIKNTKESCSLGELNADGSIKQWLALYVNAGALIMAIRKLIKGVDSRGYGQADRIYKSLTLREDKNSGSRTASKVENFTL